VELVELGPLTAETRAELEGGEVDPFDVQGLALEFRKKERHVALRDPEGRLVASTGMVLADVEIAHERAQVVGLGGVLVNHRYRGRGFGRGIVQTALTRAQTMGPDFALLFCLTDRVGFYERLGFSRVPPPVSVEQPTGVTEMPLHTMWYPLAESAIWPAGPTRLCGLPF
jgi:predicted GNAT family N-acyltransferase